ncbi:hypothetical protein M378DRAFT_159015 [Amanita muscaria Koide BX008]|uniref:Borealin N-terminal domain-containing protein n=1 Tax=Amanita muscaria (strain Koide BX008) TaxID=946122 RepID=A0A0C2XEE8_AMAMK|nr:hypothetical protein M378DRAFT_159015 [Amanita muscaria Koide BX008]
MDPSHPRRRYTDEEKLHLLANLDLEVAHRTRQLEECLADRLENFHIHQQGQISRIPKQVRTMIMREFGEKYNGNVQEALRGVQKERMAAAGLDANFAEIDKSERKRKWIESQEVEPEASGSGSRKDAEKPRGPKSARIMSTTTTTTPKKQTLGLGHGNPQRARLLTSNKPPTTPRAISRTAPSPSPQKPRPPFVTGSLGRPPSRPTSPTKHPATRPPVSRVPSSSTFNPSLPPKTPSYPTIAHKSAAPSASGRLPRKDESMLSLNGSPLVNPYQFGLGWSRGVEMAENATDPEDDVDVSGTAANGQAKPLRRTNSSIVIRQDPSLLANGQHSRTESQIGHHGSIDAPLAGHSREPSQTLHPYHSKPPSYSSEFPHPPNTQAFLEAQTTPKTRPHHSRSFSALVAIPTKDGRLLEFDPLHTSPGALDAQEGLTDSTKKQARLEVGRFLQAAVEKWNVG